MMLFARTFIFLLGLALAAVAVLSAVKTIVLPRSAPDPIVRFIFHSLRRAFSWLLRPARTYAQRDAIMAFFGPVALLALMPAWLFVIAAGYMAMYWALGGGSFYDVLVLSGSSLLTLGFARGDRPATVLLSFSEATLGLIMVAILIAYLPTIYAAFARRESAVTMLEVRAGSPPSAVEMIKRYQRLHGLPLLGELWTQWELWFTELEESHSSLAALVFFRSPKAERSWVTAAGAVLDAAALVNSAVDTPHNAQADLTIRAGFLALRSISDFFNIPYDPNPTRGDPISISRAEFEAALDDLAVQGVPLKPDRDAAWADFAGWRVNYDTVLVALARITMAPPAPWSSDRQPLGRGELAHQRKGRRLRPGRMTTGRPTGDRQP